VQQADVIVVGAGAAGAVVAAELSRDRARRVIVLEAGGSGRNPIYRVPLMTGILANLKFGMWTDWTVAEAFLAGRRIKWPHGRVVGGSSAINGMVWMRGRPSDFARWAASGLPSWNWDAVLRAYHMIENDPQDPQSRGPVTVAPHANTHPLYTSFVEAGVQAGHPRASDFNRGPQEGVGRMTVNIGHGQRQSSYKAFLEPAAARGNLKVITHALVERILLERNRAVGVAAVINGVRTPISAKCIVLCGGAINSPHLMLLSGIGAATELGAHGIAVQHELPGVGCNLQDHVCVRVGYESREPVSLHSLTRVDRAVVGFLAALMVGRGAAATTPFGAGFLLKSDPAQPEPDLEGVFLPMLPSARLWAPVVWPSPSTHGFAGTVYGLRPESRGRISLRSPDPAVRPEIVANYLATEHDRETLRRGVRLLREIFYQPAFDRYRGKALFATAADDDRSLDRAISECANSAYHPVGSCKMGPATDRMAVVDERLSVHGIDGLYIADASIMPTITSGNTHAPSMMIGYRCAEFMASG
jgi:choline dehydrogenase